MHPTRLPLLELEVLEGHFERGTFCISIGVGEGQAGRRLPDK